MSERITFVLSELMPKVYKLRLPYPAPCIIRSIHLLRPENLRPNATRCIIRVHWKSKCDLASRSLRFATLHAIHKAILACKTLEMEIDKSGRFLAIACLKSQAHGFGATCKQPQHGNVAVSVCSLRFFLVACEHKETLPKKRKTN